MHVNHFQVIMLKQKLKINLAQCVLAQLQQFIGAAVMINHVTLSRQLLYLISLSQFIPHFPVTASFSFCPLAF